MLWHPTGTDQPDVRTILDTPCDGSIIRASLAHSYLAGELLLERPCELQLGFHTTASLRVGAFTYSFSLIGPNVESIGRYCSIAHDVVFGHPEHLVDLMTTSTFPYQADFLGHLMPGLDRSGFTARDPGVAWKRRPIRIGNDVWIGAHAYLKAGIRIGDGAVIGARAVVTKDVPPFAIVVGNPGRIIRHRFPPEIVERLLRLGWWHYPFFRFEGLDATDVTGSIARIERLVADGMEPFRPRVTRIVGDGHAILHAALEPPFGAEDGHAS